MSKRIVVALIMVSLLAGCKKEEATTSIESSPSQPQRESAKADALTAVATVPDSPGGSSAKSLAAAAPVKDPRMIVKTASISLVVADTPKSFDELTTLVGSMGGFVDDSKRWRDGDQVHASLVVRVPADRLNTMLAAVRRVAMRVQSENVSGEDVTQEFVDLESRARNLEAAEIEMRTLMATVREKSSKAEDILAVYEKLTELRGQIEQARGRMRYLSQRSAFSTVNVELIPDAAAKPIVAPGWQPLAQLRQAGRGLVTTLQWLAGVAIWLIVYALPLLLIAAAVFWTLKRIVRALRRRSAE